MTRGDGAACEGVSHESLNLAALWQPPPLYVCENNQWQAFVSRREAMAARHVADHAAAYGVEAQVVDGNDVLAVHAAAQRAAATVRATRRPFLLEFVPQPGAIVDPAMAVMVRTGQAMAVA